ncbi:hypothetical protein BDN70DRAFT_903039 [Pholiota conissans]|uniref:Protein kinase domain-containing protein n=1 Tax=Pholiota conissans TaxID=109636 RepID=A0A9P6CYN6_9AGAR|nr:hypothetical protein BDN70DRAFT_903039 [Pholiota conissans]
MSDSPIKRLTDSEVYWRDKQPWLLSCGYQLRARYQPDWVPSWITNPPPNPHTGKWKREDFPRRGSAPVMDAIRLSDNVPVMLKEVYAESHPGNQELEVSLYVQSEEQRKDPDNHCVHVYEVLDIPGDEHNVIIVMPLLCPFDFPRFDTIGECLDFFLQIFKGLRYLHRHHIAHRDCTGLNVMMDPSEILPYGFHPVRHRKNREFTGPAYQKYTRTQRPPKYYWIDFGLSVRFHENDASPRVTGLRANDQSAPELRGDDLRQQHDPFPTDIYYLGNLVRTYFTEGHPDYHSITKKMGFEFMQPLVEVMVQENPAKRPTIEQCVVLLEEIVRSQSSCTLRSQFWQMGDTYFGFLYRFFPHWIRRIIFIVTRTPAIPHRSD